MKKENVIWALHLALCLVTAVIFTIILFKNYQESILFMFVGLIYGYIFGMVGYKIWTTFSKFFKFRKKYKEALKDYALLKNHVANKGSYMEYINFKKNVLHSSEKFFRISFDYLNDQTTIKKKIARKMSKNIHGIFEHLNLLESLYERKTFKGGRK